MSSQSRVRNRISPIQMKSGSAVSFQLDVEPQNARERFCRPGACVKQRLPIQPTIASVRRDPDAAREQHEHQASRIAPTTRMPCAQSVDSARSHSLRVRSSIADDVTSAPAANHEHELVDEGDRKSSDRADRNRRAAGSRAAIAIMPGRDVVEDVALAR